MPAHAVKDRDDYQRFLREYGLSEDMVRSVSDNKSDRVEMPAEWDKLRQGPSDIQGDGLFAVVPVDADEVISPARLNGCRTPAGWCLNHSCTPNARFALGHDAELYAISVREISAGEEVTVDYRQAGIVNGWGIRPATAEVIKTIQARLCRLRVEKPALEIERIATDALDKIGYLPSFPQFMDYLNDHSCWKGAST